LLVNLRGGEGSLTHFSFGKLTALTEDDDDRRITLQHKHDRQHSRLKTTITRVWVKSGLDWIVQCFTSPPTQYRLYGRRVKSGSAGCGSANRSKAGNFAGRLPLFTRLQLIVQTFAVGIMRECESLLIITY